jgi:hypothetical protein
MNLAVQGCHFVKGILESAEVVNGGWYLYRSNNDWLACSDTDKRTTQHRWPIREDDNIIIDVRDCNFSDYNKAIQYVKEQEGKK